MAGVKSAGFTTPTPIQKQAIPVVLQGRDLLGLAQTGTGKTAAFLLPTFERLLQAKLGRPKSNHARMVVLAPTRELVIQITGQARQLASHTSLNILDVYGGAKMKKQISQLHKGVDIIIATGANVIRIANPIAVGVVGIVERAGVASVGYAVPVIVDPVIPAGANVVRVADPVAIGIIRIVQRTRIAPIDHSITIAIGFAPVRSAVVVAVLARWIFRGAIGNVALIGYFILVAVLARTRN